MIRMSGHPGGRASGNHRGLRMFLLTIRRIDCASADAAAQLAALRAEPAPRATSSRARGRELTQKVFGEALPPVRVVERICEDVRTRGWRALTHTEQFDRIRLAPETCA